ncbi:MAG: hypothetical protein EA367_09035 [Leptolyngbya sp. DLM2.Bin15]|nr:MAG: hypothetical protein EA367_09035 [Leptolyngbya sp. DLM2.Bin15]
MWQKFRNLVRNVSTYQALSPDLRIRRRVNSWLGDRSPLSQDKWAAVLRESWGISRAVASFAYTHLEQYSGLQVARLRPSDRLDDDLQWAHVCWFDWQLCLCDDFCRRFGVDISDRLDQLTPSTVADLLVFLEKQLHRSSTADLPCDDSSCP